MFTTPLIRVFAYTAPPASRDSFLDYLTVIYSVKACLTWMLVLRNVLFIGIQQKRILSKQSGSSHMQLQRRMESLPGIMITFFWLQVHKNFLTYFQILMCRVNNVHYVLHKVQFGQKLHSTRCKDFLTRDFQRNKNALRQVYLSAGKLTTNCFMRNAMVSFEF